MVLRRSLSGARAARPRGFAAALLLAASGVIAGALPARAELADRTVCVVSASPETATTWARVLQEQRLAARVIDALDLDQVSNRPDLLSCGAVFASSDSALYWKGHPGAWKAASTHPLFLMGNTAELAGPHGAGAENARFVPGSGRSITLSAEVAAGLALPTLAREPDGLLALYKDDVPMRGLVGVDPRRASDVVAIGHAGAAADAPIGIAVVESRVLWTFGGTADGLTAGGRALLAALVKQILPADPADVARADAARRFSDDPADAPSPDDGESLGPSDAAAPPRVLPAQASRQAPRLEFVKSFAGAPRTFDGLSGHVNLVVFWATWCGWCRKEMPEVQKLSDVLGKRGVAVTAVSIDKRPSTVDDFLRRGGFTFPTVVTTPGAQKSYGLSGVPSAVLLDKYGRIRARYAGAGSFRLAQVEPAAAALLAGK